jgi:hypothetical protein
VEVKEAVVEEVKQDPEEQRRLLEQTKLVY